MTDTQAIRIHYPPDRGRILLRTDADWQRSIEPAVATEGVFEFRVRDERPFFYFKPVLVDRDRAEHWALGENRLALVTPGIAQEEFPWFFEEPMCSLCELMTSVSTGSGVEHRYRVFLPPGYAENPFRRFPVLYMHDGQNLFLKEEAFLGHTWKTDEILSGLASMCAVEPAIVVGVFPKEREREYTKPGYEDYTRFLADVLKPAIDSRYRTQRGAGRTAVMGSSLGGVVSFHAGWQRPEVFGRIACLSSTFGWRDDLLSRVTHEPRRPIRIYLDSGWPSDNYEAVRAMRDRLVMRGYGASDDLMYFAFPGARHDENAWADRSHIPYQFLLGRRPNRPASQHAVPAA